MPCPWAYVRPEDDEDSWMVCEDCKGTGMADQGFVGAGLCITCAGIGSVMTHGTTMPPSTIAMAMPAVGDINSEDRGTGARYNSGKVPWELMPISVAVDLLEPARDEQLPILKAMRELGTFQARENDTDYLMRRVLEETADAADMTVQELLEEAAHVLAHGATKYKSWNWAKGMPWSVPIGCAMRHLLKMWEFPRAQDQESHRLHAGHVAANVIFLLTYMATYPEGDDRPTTLREKA